MFTSLVLDGSVVQFSMIKTSRYIVLGSVSVHLHTMKYITVFIIYGEHHKNIGTIEITQYNCSQYG